MINISCLYSLEGMSIVCLLYGLCDRFVDSEGDGAEERQQRQIRKHTDHGEAGDGHQCDQAGAKDNAGLFHITPVDQGLHCKKRKKRIVSNALAGRDIFDDSLTVTWFA